MVIRNYEYDAALADLGQYAGVRMGAEEFRDLADETSRYELVNGVVVLSPSPTPAHQRVAAEIFAQLFAFLRSSAVGHVLYEIDVLLERGAAGRGDLVYKPDLLFIRGDKAIPADQPLAVIPDLVVEVVSGGTRKRDTTQKRADYERVGVGEYWIVDPELGTMEFLVLRSGKYESVAPSKSEYSCAAVTGFRLDVDAVRAAFHAS